MKPAVKPKDKKSYIRIKKRSIKFVMTCPMCRKTFKNAKVNSLKAFNGWTIDCPNKKCRQILLIHKGRLISFHKYMNKLDSNWPADGKNTGYVEIGLPTARIQVMWRLADENCNYMFARNRKFDCTDCHGSLQVY